LKVESWELGIGNWELGIRKNSGFVKNIRAIKMIALFL
jgi:hypothetical protein